MDMSDNGTMRWIHHTYYPISKELIKQVDRYAGCVLADVRMCSASYDNTNCSRAKVLQVSRPCPCIDTSFPVQGMYSGWGQAGVKIRTKSRCSDTAGGS